MKFVTRCFFLSAIIAAIVSLSCLNLYAADTWKPREPQDLLVVLVNFKDTKMTTTRDQWQKRFFGENNTVRDEDRGIDLPFPSVNEYYKENSGGKFYFNPAKEIDGTPNDGIITLDLDIDHIYKGKTDKQIKDDVNGIISLFKKTLNTIIKKGNNSGTKLIDFSQYDKNKNKIIDKNELTIVAIYAGYDCVDHYDMQPALWPQAYDQLYCTDTYKAPGSSKSYNITIKHLAGIGEKKAYQVTSSSGADTKVTKGKISGIGTICHEIGHLLGLADLYNTNNDKDRGGVGWHSLMGQGNHNGAENSEETKKMPNIDRGEYPAHLDPFSKIKLNFIKPMEANVSGKYLVSSFDSSLGYNVIKIKIPGSNKYYLIENKHLGGFDKGIKRFTSPGIAIWLVNPNKYNYSIYNNNPNNNKWDRSVELVLSNQNRIGKKELDEYLDYTSGQHYFSSETKSYFTSGSIPASNQKIAITNMNEPSQNTWINIQIGSNPVPEIDAEFSDMYEFKIMNKMLPDVLEDENTTDPLSVHLNEDKDMDSQKWQIVATGDGYYKIKNISTKEIIGVSMGSEGEEIMTIAESAAVDDREKWYLVKEDDSYKIVNKKANMFLTFDGDKLVIKKQVSKPPKIPFIIVKNGNVIFTSSASTIKHSQKWYIVPCDNKLIRAVISGGGKNTGKSFFFQGEKFRRYNWSTKEFEDTGSLPSFVWHLPKDFIDFDTAFQGAGVFSNTAFFIKGDRYVAYDFVTERATSFADTRGTLGYRWKLPAPFGSSVDAAVNGKGAYAGKTLFFKDSQYIVYDWNTHSVGSVKSISELGLPAPFNRGVDAAAEGQGSELGKTFFIKEGKCVAYDWSSGAITGDVTTIYSAFPKVMKGLSEKPKRNVIVYFTIDPKNHRNDKGEMVLELDHTPYLNGLKEIASKWKTAQIYVDDWWINDTYPEMFKDPHVLCAFGGTKFSEWHEYYNDGEMAKLCDAFSDSILDTRVPFFGVDGMHQLFISRVDMMSQMSKINHMEKAGDEDKSITIDQELVMENGKVVKVIPKIPNPRRGEVGIFPLEFDIQNFKNDPLLNAFMSPYKTNKVYYFAENHHDELKEPEKGNFTLAKLSNEDALQAKSNVTNHITVDPAERTNYQMYNFDIRTKSWLCYTTQFHPELRSSYFTEWLDVPASVNAANIKKQADQNGEKLLLKFFDLANNFFIK